MRKHSIYFIILMFFFAGCARVPEKDLASVMPAISLADSQTLALDQALFVEGDWPTEEWWEMFEDAQLTALMEMALESNPTLQQAIAKVDEFRQEAKAARSALFPELDANYEENWAYFSKNGFVRSFYPTMPGVIVPATTNQLDLTLNFQYEIDFWGKNRNLYRAALGLAKAQIAEAYQARLIVTTLIAQTYFDLQANLLERQVLEDRLDQRGALFQLNAWRYSAGVDNGLPVLSAERDVISVDEALIFIDRAIALDEHLLKVLVGIGPDEPLLNEPLQAAFDRPFSLPTELSIDLLARRPDLIAQIWQVESAAKMIRVAQADFYPSVNLMALAGLQSLSFSKLLRMGSKQGALQPAIHLPIFTGGRLRANLGAKVAQFNEAVYGYNNTLLQAAKDVADQIVTLQAAFDAFVKQETSMEVTEKRYALTWTRFKLGLDDFTTLLNYEAELLTERSLLVFLQRDQRLAVVQLIKALGGGFTAKPPEAYSKEAS